MDNKEYRLLPVALHPAIEEALKRHCMMPNTAWQDVIAVWDRVSRGAQSATSDDRHFTPMTATGTVVYLGRSGGFDVSHCPEAEYLASFIAAACNAYAAPERSGKTADDGQQCTLSIARIVKNAILGNSHPCDDGYLMFTSESEVLDVGKQVERAVAASSSDDVPVTMSTFGSKEACEAEHRRRAASSSAAPGDEKAPLSDPWVEAVRKAEQFCPHGLSSPDRWRWKAKYLRAALATPSVQAVAAGREQIFTYAGVTQNIEASRFGEAARRTMQKPGGDSIDTGLQLLLELQNMGYGIVSVPRLSTKPPALAGDTKAGE